MPEKMEPSKVRRERTYTEGREMVTKTEPHQQRTAVRKGKSKREQEKDQPETLLSKTTERTNARLREGKKQKTTNSEAPKRHARDKERKGAHKTQSY